MTKQPESLRLADALEQKEYPPRRTAAAELRRLHAENERLREAVKAEREACAKLCEQEQFELTEDVTGKNALQLFDSGCRCCAEMIRRRGE
jgi:Mg/Co/Ni transporter MgtE